MESPLFFVADTYRRMATIMPLTVANGKKVLPVSLIFLAYIPVILQAAGALAVLAHHGHLLE